MLDDDSVEAVQEVIEKLMAGEVISEPRKTELQEIYEVDDADDGEYLDNHASDDEYDDFYWENGGYESDKTSKAQSSASDAAALDSTSDETDDTYCGKGKPSEVFDGFPFLGISTEYRAEKVNSEENHGKSA